MKIYNINNKNHFKEEKEYIIHDYNTINNDDIKERNNFENNSLVKSNKESINIFDNDRKIHNYNNKNNYKIKSAYYSNKNKNMNRSKNIHNYIKPKHKSHSTNQASISYKNSPKRILLNKFYLSKNKDNNSELSTISIKANMVINEFKKTLLEAEKMENELNKSKYSLKSYTGLGANGNNIINTFRNANLNQTKTDIINNSYLISNNSTKNIYKNNNINDINFNEDEFMYEDEIDKIKMQNLVLMKSNQALKNQNKILEHEMIIIP
jgi:hypothetical protein